MKWYWIGEKISEKFGLYKNLPKSFEIWINEDFVNGLNEEQKQNLLKMYRLQNIKGLTLSIYVLIAIVILVTILVI